MKSLNHYVSIYQNQLKKGDILIAYNELVKFVMNLRTEFTNKLSDRYSFAGVLHGYMDYTYFYFSNDYLKAKKLKFGLVLNHMEMRIEVWLLGNTKPVQENYWELSKNSKWSRGKVEMPTYSILESTLVENPDFDDLAKLAEMVEIQMIKHTDEILNFLKTLN